VSAPDDRTALCHGFIDRGNRRLDGARARRLFVRVGTLSLVLWALALGAVMLMPFVFPEIESASFFSTTLVENRPPLDFVALYIPSNPFHSLANNIVPAVVLFSVFLGVARSSVSSANRASSKT
jgi:proton glutamate symport protein